MLREDFRDSVWVAGTSGSSIFCGYRNVDTKPWTVFMSFKLSVSLCLQNIFEHNDSLGVTEVHRLLQSLDYYVVITHMGRALCCQSLQWA